MRMTLPDWTSVFALETPLLELAARATILYFGILFLIRWMPRRSGGELAIMDLIFALLIADAAGHSLGDYTSVADGLSLVVLIMLWNYLVNVLSYRFTFFAWLVAAPPIQVIRNGTLLRRNMRRELLTEEELIGALREQGIESVADVKSAYVEGEGRISVIARKGRE